MKKKMVMEKAFDVKSVRLPGSLSDVRNTVIGFKIAIKRLESQANEMIGLAEDVRACIGMPAPTVCHVDIDEAVISKSHSDEAFVRQFASICRGKTAQERMAHCVRYAQHFVQSIKAFVPKIEKINERIRVNKRETDSEKAEYVVCINRRQTLLEDCASMTSKIGIIAKRFYRERERIIRTVGNITQGFYDVVGAMIIVREALPLRESSAQIEAIVGADKKFYDSFKGMKK